MNIVSFIFFTLACFLPRFWIESYDATNPIFWTVLGAGFIGMIIGFVQGFFKED